jgi:hypothetical protein
MSLLRKSYGLNMPVAAVIAAALAAAARSAAAEPAGETPATVSAPTLSEIEVFARRDRDPSEISADARRLVDVPGALGDPVSAAFSLPGVVYAGGDTGTPAVRGSGPADNLYLVDGLPVAYVFHTLDIGASVFSDLALGTFELRPAAYGPEYSNVTGAVFDLGLRDPRNQALAATVDLSMIRSGVFVESGITANSAAYVSARQSLFHLFIKSGTTTDGIELQKPPRDSDYQAKYVWRVGDGQKLTLAASGATDTAQAGFQSSSQIVAENPDFAGDARLDTHYNNQSITWDTSTAGAGQLRVAYGHSRQDSDSSLGLGYYFNDRLERHTVRALYDQPLSDTHTLHLTGEWQQNRHTADYRQVLFVCNEFDPTCVDSRRGIVSGTPSFTDSSRVIAASDTWHLSPKIRLDLGGQWHHNTYTSESFVEPRASVHWSATPATTWSAKAGAYDRFPDTIDVYPGIGNPALKSSRANHYALGFKHDAGDGYSLSVEPYFKTLSRLPLALDQTQPDSALLYSNDVHGRAYGLDLLLEKKPVDRWSGWVAVSYSRSERTNERTGFASRYYLDTPIIANAVVAYQWRPSIELGARLTVRSGQPTTPIVGVVENPYFPGYVAPEYGVPYSERLPTYTRLDLRAKWSFTFYGIPSSLSLDIINVLNAKNVEFRQLDYAKSVAGGPVYTKEYTGLPFFPALSLRMRF